MKTLPSIIFFICIVAVSVFPIATSAEIEPTIRGVYWADVYENSDSIVAVEVSGENVIVLGKSGEESVIWSATTRRGELRWHQKLGRGIPSTLQKLSDGGFIAAEVVNNTMLWLVKLGKMGEWNGESFMEIQTGCWYLCLHLPLTSRKIY